MDVLRQCNNVVKRKLRLNHEKLLFFYKAKCELRRGLSKNSKIILEQLKFLAENVMYVSPIGQNDHKI